MRSPGWKALSASISAIAIIQLLQRPRESVLMRVVLYSFLEGTANFRQGCFAPAKYTPQAIPSPCMARRRSIHLHYTLQHFPSLSQQLGVRNPTLRTMPWSSFIREFHFDLSELVKRLHILKNSISGQLEIARRFFKPTCALLLYRCLKGIANSIQ